MSQLNVELNADWNRSHQSGIGTAVIIGSKVFILSYQQTVKIYHINKVNDTSQARHRHWYSWPANNRKSAVCCCPTCDTEIFHLGRTRQCRPESRMVSHTYISIVSFLLPGGTKWYSINLKLYLCGNRKKFHLLKYRHGLPLWCHLSYFYFQIIRFWMLAVDCGQQSTERLDRSTLKVSTALHKIKCFLDAAHGLT